MAQMKIKKLTTTDKKHLRSSLEALLQECENDGRNPGIAMQNFVSSNLKNINTDVKKETAEQYRELFKSKINKDSDADLVSHLLECGTKNSFDKTRSAFRFCIAEEIKKLLNESDKARKEKNFELMKEKTIEAYRQYILFEKEFLSDSRLVWGDISHKKRGSLSKKKTMNSVATTRSVFDGLKSKQGLLDRYGMILAVSSLTGCRPAEIQKGIGFEIENGKIHMSISGAKVGDDRGQETRKLTFNLKDYAEDEQMNYILSKFNYGQNYLNYKCSKKDYNSLRQYLYINHNGFSLYTLRHRVSSQLKKEGLPEDIVAGFLGHRTTRSQSNYGYSKSALKGLSVDSVECTSDIKIDSRSKYTRTPKTKNNRGVGNNLPKGPKI